MTKIYFLPLQSSYVRVSVNTDVEDLVKFMAIRWLKRSPKIIIPVVTGLNHFKNWKNQKQINKFKRGLIKVNPDFKNKIKLLKMFS